MGDSIGHFNASGCFFVEHKHSACADMQIRTVLHAHSPAVPIYLPPAQVLSRYE